MKGKTKPAVSGLDDYCRKILFALIVFGKEIRFNDFHDFLGEHGVELTKPTLVKHLRHHLVEKELVIRKVDGAPIITYEVNHKLFRDLEESVKSTIEARKLLTEETEIFNSKSLEEQIDIILEKILFRNLSQLKANIELELRPSKKWEKSMELAWLANPVFRYHEDLVINRCKEDSAYGEKLLLKIDEIIEQFKELNTKNG